MSRKFTFAMVLLFGALMAAQAMMPDNSSRAAQAALDNQATSSELACHQGIASLTPKARQARIEAQINGTLNCR